MYILKNLILDYLGKRDDNYFWRGYSNKIDLKSYKNICINHQDGKLGDAILISSFVNELYLYDPKINITVVTNSSLKKYWAFNNKIKEVIIIPNRVKSGKLSTLYKLYKIIETSLSHRKKFDIAISFEPINTIDIFLNLRILKSKINIGFNKFSYKLFLIALLDNTLTIDKIHISSRILSVLILFNIHTKKEKLKPFLPLYNNNYLMDNFNINTNNAYSVMINSYAAGSDRSFSNEVILKIIKKLNIISSEIIIYINLKDNYLERFLLKNIGEISCKYIKYIYPLSDIFDLIYITSKMNLVITPDTGIAHIAAGLDIVNITFFKDFNYNPIVWKPNSEKTKILVSENGDINEINWTNFDSLILNIGIPVK